MGEIHPEQGRKCVWEIARHQFVKEAQEAKEIEEVEEAEFEVEGYKAKKD